MTDDGVRIEVRVTGDGPGLILVHGFGGAKEDFADHVEALSRRARVVTFDHRGHGESDAPDDVGAYSLDRLAADVRIVADACELESFRLLGHSMGGMVARRLVLAMPERVEALVLMDTSPGPIDGIDPVLLDRAAAHALSEGKESLKTLLDAAATLETPAYQKVLDERPGYREFQEAKWNALSVVMWAAMGRDMAHQPNDLARLAWVACPALVIVGEQDAPFLGACRDMAATIPGAEFVMIPRAGHSPQFENPDAWFLALSRFLDRLDPAERTA
ncbi:MAG TPA: alpha/beta fold hydrolase [Acidimicrobiia bacterium]|nr:alpha/beta fold hydrolase [Acidimicrobiia bacterium]